MSLTLVQTFTKYWPLLQIFHAKYKTQVFTLPTISFYEPSLPVKIPLSSSLTNKPQLSDTNSNSDEDSGSSQTRERSDTGTQADDEADDLRKSIAEEKRKQGKTLAIVCGMSTDMI